MRPPRGPRKVLCRGCGYKIGMRNKLARGGARQQPIRQYEQYPLRGRAPQPLAMFTHSFKVDRPRG